MKTLPDNVAFKFRDLEITRDALVLHFYNDKTVTPLAEIKSYQLQWHLHDPTFGKKFWFLVLTVQLSNGQEESGSVASIKFNYLGDDLESRQQIARRLSDSLDIALVRAAGAEHTLICV